jgi:hypothetical protein
MDRRVAKTLEIMRRDFHRDFRVAELAATVDLSPSRFARLFHHDIGMPIQRYLARMRFHDAWVFLDELLQEPLPGPVPAARPPRATRQLIYAHPFRFTGPNGTRYSVCTFAEQRRDGDWIGWIEFHPRRGSADAVLRTGHEVTRPSRKALATWAGGLERVYFEEAFRRAH